jgi:hypothetical protein
MKIWECIIIISGLLRSAPIGTPAKRPFKTQIARPILISKPNALGMRKMGSSKKPIGPPPQLGHYQKKSNPAQVAIGNLITPLNPPDELIYVDHSQKWKEHTPASMQLLKPSYRRENGNVESDETAQFLDFDEADIDKLFETYDDILLATSLDDRFPEFESLHPEASVTDATLPSKIWQSPSNFQESATDTPSKRIVSMDEFVDFEEVNLFQRKFEEFKSYIAKGNTIAAQLMLNDFKGEEKNIILKYAFLEKKWYLTRRMLEKGFDPSEIVKFLNNLPASEAVEKADKIGFYGIFKDEDGFKYKTIQNDVSTPLQLVKFDKFRFLRSISPDLVRARHQIHPNLRRILELFFTQGFLAGDKELSKLGGFQKAIALAVMVDKKKWDIVKQMILHGYSQKVFKNLLAQYPDMAAMQVYDELSPFDYSSRISPSDLYKLYY